MGFFARWQGTSKWQLLNLGWHMQGEQKRAANMEALILEEEREAEARAAQGGRPSAREKARAREVKKKKQQQKLATGRPAMLMDCGHASENPEDPEDPEGPEGPEDLVSSGASLNSSGGCSQQRSRVTCHRCEMALPRLQVQGASHAS